MKSAGFNPPPTPAGIWPVVWAVGGYLLRRGGWMAAGAAGEYIFDFFQEGKITEQRDKAPVSGQTAMPDSGGSSPDAAAEAQLTQMGGTSQGSGDNRHALIPWWLWKKLLGEFGVL